jgi:hypothetical protein
VWLAYRLTPVWTSILFWSELSIKVWTFLHLTGHSPEKLGKMKNIFLFLGLFLSFVACKNPGAGTNTTDGTDTLAVMKYTLTAFTPSQDYPDAAIDSIHYKGGKFTADISGTTYKLGEQTPDAPLKQCANSKEGQHLHLIVDNEPYVAQYVNSFDHEMTDGEHYVLTFLSRSYHESLKHASAHQAIKATVKDKTFDVMQPVEGPMLFYSRPKGLYTGEDKKKVMLDFYMVNAGMSNYMVEADINGEKHMITTWEPYYIEGLPDGDNTITLSLLNKDSSLVNTPLNPVTRTFQLEKTPETN